jgi:hypothetical protein
VTGDEDAGHGFGVVKEERHKVWVDGEPAGALVHIPKPSVKYESDDESAIADMIQKTGGHGRFGLRIGPGGATTRGTVYRSCL